MNLFFKKKPENPLEECNRFLKPLEEFASTYVDTHVLAFEVYLRKNKLMLMLRALKKLKALIANSSSTKARFHYTLCKFLIKCMHFSSAYCIYNYAKIYTV